MISLIAAMSKNRVIGVKNSLPWHVPEDLKFFKEKTRGKPVVMGRKTFESMGRALPKRPNLVITRDPNWKFDGVEVFLSLQDALDRAEEIDPDFFVIGGAEIYKLALPLADRIWLTQIDLEVENGDAFFPEFESIYPFVKTWSEHHEGDPSYTFMLYEHEDLVRQKNAGFELDPAHTDPERMKSERAKAKELKNSTWWKEKIQDGVCHYCHKKVDPKTLTMDHVIPLARGGVSSKNNLVPSCLDCNQKKKLETPVDLLLKKS